MYYGVCDGCGKELEQDYDVIAWCDKGTVYEQMQDNGWLEINGKHYCTDCYEYNEELDEYVPKQKVR